MRTPLAILTDGRGNDAKEYTTGPGYRFANSLPRIECADGFSLSVQAGRLLYSRPREDAGPWTHVEVGYPSAVPEPWADWETYCEEPSRPEGTVYAYVPIRLVLDLIDLHGGVKP
jgi:hypothetical protein